MMIVRELIEELGKVDPSSTVVFVVYTKDSYEAGYPSRIDPNAKYNCITGEKLEDGESIVEITTSTGVVE